MAEDIKIVIDPAKCVLTGECIKICPLNAIFAKDGKAIIDQDKCDLDGLCIPACPQGAIHMVGDTA